MAKKQERFQLLTKGNVTLTKDRISRFVNMILDTIEEDRLVYFEFNIRYDRYYRNLKTLREIRKKKKIQLPNIKRR